MGPLPAYHAIPEGWDAVSVEKAHGLLHGTFDIRPLQMPVECHPWLKYRQCLYNIADGVSSDDAACVELAIRFIQLDYIGSYSGYIRSLFARRLKHAHLTARQGERLSLHFFSLLQQGARRHEYDEYLTLWRMIALPADITRVEQLVREIPQPKFFADVLEKLKFGIPR